MSMDPKTRPKAVLVPTPFRIVIALFVAVLMVDSMRGDPLPEIHLGDIIRFSDGVLHRRMTDGDETSARAEAVVPMSAVNDTDGGRVCALDPNYLAVHGGSLVVTKVDPAHGVTPVRVHWMGPATTMGVASCGTDADLWLNERDLGMLALYAGGWGIEH